MSTVAAARGPYAKGIRRRQQILEAASATFARRGYTNASLREIADAVGVTPAALLRHFGSKEELLLAVLQRWDSGALIKGPRIPPSEGLAYFDVLPVVMDRHREQPGLIELFLALCTEVSDHDHPARSWVVDRYARIVAEAVEALTIAEQRGESVPMAPKQREIEARILYSVMDGLELQWIADPTIDLGAAFRPVFDLTLARWRGPQAVVRGES